MPVRIAYLTNFAPKKNGTGENRLALLARTSREFGHTTTMFCHEPIHKTVRSAFADAGQRIEPIDELAEHPIRSIAILAKHYDALVLNAIAPRSRIALIAYLAWPTKVFYVDHSSGPVNSFDYASQPLWRRLLDRLTVMRIYKAAGVSEYVTNRLRTRFGFDSDRARTIYGGVDVARYKPAGQPPDERSLQITAVAALIPQKGVDVLLQAFSMLGNVDARLSIVGEGPDKARLQEIAKDLGIDGQVDFLGLRDDVDKILQATDVFVHPAIWEEALGYTILEGMAASCAVIASDSGAVRELIRDGENGLLIPPGDARQLASYLTDLAQDSKFRRELGRRARKTVVDGFSLEKNVEETLEWFVS